MAKQPRRKPPKRKVSEKPVAIDDELSELAAVIDQHRLDQNAEGWFEIPWRDGWNATDLAYHAFERLTVGNDHLELTKILGERKLSAELYWRASEEITNNNALGSSRFLYAAWRCLQVLVSNSSGGGVVYNDILRRAFRGYDGLEDIVLMHRMRDALGVHSVMDGGTMDRARGAFRIAWKRGLYHAAYSIRPAPQVTVTTTVWVSGKDQ